MTYRMTKKEVHPRIFHVQMEGQRILCRTFMRFQEYYESPEFRGKIFSRDQYRRWYKKDQKCKKFTYEIDWNGFNIPSYVLDPFYDGMFDPLLQCEKDLLNLFHSEKEEKFYVIGTHNQWGNGLEDLTHEIAHALWYLDDDYRKEQKKVLNSISKDNKEDFYNWLSMMGYCKEVFDDEVQAYLSTSERTLEEYGFPTVSYRKQIKKMKEVYNTYSPIII